MGMLGSVLAKRIPVGEGGEGGPGGVEAVGQDRGDRARSRRRDKVGMSQFRRREETLAER